MSKLPKGTTVKRPSERQKTAPKAKPTSLITFLLDRSGSMASCRSSTIEAFNGYICGLKDEKDAEISFTLLQFDSQSLDKCHVNVPVSDVPDLNHETYVPRGMTPLIDACVKTIHAVDAALKTRSDKPKIVICFQTDGQENHSRAHTWEELSGLVKMKTTEGWQFNFMGAGIEGYDQATKMGIAAMSTMSYNAAKPEMAKAAFVASAMNATSFAAGRSANTQYSASQRASSGDVHSHKWVGTTLVVTPPALTPTPLPVQPAWGALDLTNATSAIPATSPAKPTSAIPDFSL